MVLKSDSDDNADKKYKKRFPKLKLPEMKLPEILMMISIVATWFIPIAQINKIIKTLIIFVNF